MIIASEKFRGNAEQERSDEMEAVLLRKSISWFRLQPYRTRSSYRWRRSTRLALAMAAISRALQKVISFEDINLNIFCLHF